MFISRKYGKLTKWCLQRREKYHFPFCAKLLQSCPTLCDPMDHSPPGFSVHGISHARKFEYVTISTSRGSCQLRDRTSDSYVSCSGSQVFYHQHYLGSYFPFMTLKKIYLTNIYLQLEFLHEVALLKTWLSCDEFFICILCHTIVKVNCCYCAMGFNWPIINGTTLGTLKPLLLLFGPCGWCTDLKTNLIADMSISFPALCYIWGVVKLIWFNLHF